MKAFLTLTMTGFLVGCWPSQSWGDGKSAALNDLMDYYQGEKNRWDKFYQDNCSESDENPQCQAAQSMSTMYVELLAEVDSEMESKYGRTKKVKQVPFIPKSPEKTAQSTSGTE